MSHVHCPLLDLKTLPAHIKIPSNRGVSFQNGRLNIINLHPKVPKYEISLKALNYYIWYGGVVKKRCGQYKCFVFYEDSKPILRVYSAGLRHGFMGKPIAFVKGYVDDTPCVTFFRGNNVTSSFRELYDDRLGLYLKYFYGNLFSGIQAGVMKLL